MAKRYRKLYVNMGDCPADFFTSLCKHNIIETPNNTIFSKKCISFFRKNADAVIACGREIQFLWNKIPEENLPELKIKVIRKQGEYLLETLHEKNTFSYSRKNKNSKKTNIHIDVDENDIEI